MPSVTGEEKEIALVLESLLTEVGLEVERLPFDEERFSLLASRGHPRIVLCSHIDTVPPFIASSVDGDQIRGRGACDAKGIIASMIGAAAELIGEGRSGFGLLLLIGEETDSHGAKRANEQLTNRGIERVIVGEPTDLRWVRACKGAVSATVEFSGKAAHSAYPEQGVSAISRLIRAARGIEDHDWGHDPELGSATVNVGVIRGGRKANVIPDQAALELMVRSVSSPQNVVDSLSRLVEPLGGVVSSWSGGAPIALEVPPGEEGIVVGFGTDAPYLGNLGVRMLFGPGSILVAHTADERISVPEILAASETYRDVVRGYLT